MRAVREIARDIAAIREKAGATVKEVQEGTKEIAEQAQRAKTETEKLHEVARKFSDEADRGVNAFNAVGRSLRQLSTEMQRGTTSVLTWKTAMREIRSSDEALLRQAALRRGHYDQMLARAQSIVKVFRDLPEGRPVAQLAGGALGLTGERGLVAAGQRGLGVIRQLTADVPLGGLIGFLMWGGVKQQEWDAASTRVARLATGAGSVAKNVAGTIQGLFKGLQGSWQISIEDLSGMTQAFGEMGVKGEELATKFNAPKGMQQSVAGATLALDTLTGAPVGAWAKNVAQAMSVSGDSVKSMTQQMQDLALEFRGTGININALVGSFLQMQGSMRFQRQGISDIAAAYRIFRESLDSSDSLFQGMPQAASQFALAGIQSLSGAVAGLGGNIGLAAELARRTGQGGDGVEAWIALQEGRLGGEAGRGRQFGLLVGEMGKLAREVAPDSEANQKFFMMKQYGVDIAGANALLKISKKLEGKTEAEQAKILEENQKDLNRVFRDKGEETAKWQLRMENLQKGLVQISQGISGGIYLGLQLLADVAGIIEISDDEYTRGFSMLKADLTGGAQNIARGIGGTLSAFDFERYSLRHTELSASEEAALREQEYAPTRVRQLRDMLGNEANRLSPEEYQEVTARFLKATEGSRNANSWRGRTAIQASLEKDTQGLFMMTSSGRKVRFSASVSIKAVESYVSEEPMSTPKRAQ